MRLRAEQCLAWIEQRTPVATVLRDLKKADFDPEFSSAFAAVRLIGEQA
jgi:hypothetical protein